jgi:hypothetical protein
MKWVFTCQVFCFRVFGVFRGFNCFLDGYWCKRFVRRRGADGNTRGRVCSPTCVKTSGYPPDKQEKATQTVLQQAELLCADWAG